MSGPFDYEAAAVAMMTMRLDTPYGEWLDEGYQKMLAELQAAAAAIDGEEWAQECMLLAMMNLGQLAIAFLAEATGISDHDWLQRIAVQFRKPETS